CAAALVLPFFIAGLLFICASSTSITWERTPHPAGDRPSHPICSRHSNRAAKISDAKEKAA
ncbi:MAG: hypothetical protein WCA16_13110, partial [Candidatus Sulfotelmatobacter sp.]